MMMALDATSSMLDRSLSQLKSSMASEETRRASLSDKWAARRWSLRGTADTRTAKAMPRHSDAAATTPPPPPVAKTSSPPTVPPPLANTESDKEKRKRSRSVDLSPLPSSLKKAPTALTAKLVQCVESLGLRDALHRYKHYKKPHAHDEEEDDDCHHHHHHRSHAFPHHPQLDSKARRVHFPSSAAHFKQVYERPPTSPEEKAAYHYSRRELMDILVEAKESLARETRFSVQPERTIFEQGYLTFPNEHHFFHHKRYYCVLTARKLLCFASPAHAARRAPVKCRIPILKVQDCQAMSSKAKIAAFGAHLPATLALLFFVTRADGERVLLAAESRAVKKAWVHTLQQLTQVYEALPPCVLRQRSAASAASTYASDDDSSDNDEQPEDEEKKPHATPETPDPCDGAKVDDDDPAAGNNHAADNDPACSR